MAFNANEFKNAFKNTNTNTLTASPAYFEAYFKALPNCLRRKDLNVKTTAVINRVDRNMRFRASAADLPSRQLVSIQRAFNGPHKLVPYSSLYSTSIIEIIETSEYDIRTFFDTWQDLIEGNQRDFSSEYYDDLIASEFVVRAYNKEGKATQEWTFYNVFPVSVNPTQMNWSTQSSIITVAVELSYYRWKYKSLT